MPAPDRLHRRPGYGPDRPGASGNPTGAPTGGNNPTGVTLSNGHADYAVRLEGGNLTSRLKDGTKAGAPVWRDPSQVTIKPDLGGRRPRPLAARSLSSVRRFQALADSPDTEGRRRLARLEHRGDLPAQLSTGVDWRLDRVEGPGHLAVFEFDSFGQPKIIFNSTDGLPDTYKIPLGTHAHGNWSFTKPGTYKVTFTHSAGNKSDTATLTFAVGEAGSGGGSGAAAPAPGAAAGADAGAVRAGAARAGAADAGAADAGAAGAGAGGLLCPSTSPSEASAGTTGGCKLASTGGDSAPGGSAPALCWSCSESWRW